MKRFLRYILIFSIIVLVPLIAAEVYVRNMPNPARDKHQYMLAHGSEVWTLVLGSSHCFYGVNPTLLGPHAYSLAQPTQSYRYDYYQLTHYNLSNLHTVILPYSYQSLFEDIEAQPHLHFWAVRYRLYMDCDLHSPLSEYGFECLHIPAFKEKLTSLWRPAQLKWDSLGFGTSNGETSLIAQGRDNGLQRAEENTYAAMESLEDNTELLDSICSFCEARGVRLVLLTTPVTKSFREHCDPRQVAVGEQRLITMLRKHPGVIHLDHWTDPDFEDADFYDADHLNMRGANKLTRKIVGQIGVWTP